MKQTMAQHETDVKQNLSQTDIIKSLALCTPLSHDPFEAHPIGAVTVRSSLVSDVSFAAIGVAVMQTSS